MSVPADAVTVMYFTHPVNIALLRRLALSSISNCTVRPMIRGQGEPIRVQVCKVCNTGGGLAMEGDKVKTPFIQNYTMNPLDKVGK